MLILFENLTQQQTDICAVVLSASGVSYRLTKDKKVTLPTGLSKRDKGKIGEIGIYHIDAKGKKRRRRSCKIFDFDVGKRIWSQSF